MLISRPSTTSVIAVLTIRKTNAKPTKRRSVDRSVVSRDSSWPEGQRSWKATGNRCRCGEQVAPDVGLDVDRGLRHGEAAQEEAGRLGDAEQRA